MKEGYFVTRTYQAGKVWEKIKYWVPGKRPLKCGRVTKSEIKKQEQNETQTIRNAARVLNENFKAGDIILGLDYSDEGLEKVMGRFEELRGVENAAPYDDEAELYELASHEMKLFLRRVKRECDKQGVEFKYGVAVTSDMDGKTGEVVRIHHHMVINREALEIAKGKWGFGGVHHEPLSNQPDYTPVAEYFIRQVRKIRDAKKFVCSRNLVRPLPKDRIVPTNAEIRVPAKGVLLQRSEFKPGRPQYIRYLLETNEDAEREVEICVPGKNKDNGKRNTSPPPVGGATPGGEPFIVGKQSNGKGVLQ